MTAAGPGESGRGDPELLRFGLFELDPVAPELRRAGQPVRLQPQPARVLAYLVSRPGELVLREELQRHIWGDAWVDAEAGLNACIRDVRAVLGDRATAPTYVETVPRRGYRFIAPVQATGSPQKIAVEPSRPPSSGGLRRYFAIVVAAAALALAGLGLQAAFHVYDEVEPDAATPAEAGQPSPSSISLAPEAHEALLEARYLLERREIGDAERALDRARESLEHAPESAAAWLLVGQAHLLRAAPPHEAMPAARRAFQRALELDPELAAAERGLATVYWSYDWDLAAARRALDRAEALGDASSELEQSRAFLELAAGRPDKSLEHLRRALRLDPVSARLRGDIGWVYLLLGDPGAAIDECSKGLELEPDAHWLHGCLVEAHRSRDHATLAAAAARRGMAARGAPVPPPEVTPEEVLLAFDEWRLRRILEARTERWIPSCAVGIRRAQAGDSEAALDDLERAFDERSGFMLMLEVSPALRPLHGNDRFRDLASRVRAEVRRPAARG